MTTSPYIVLAIILYAFFGLFTAQAGGRIDSRLSSFIFNGLGAILPLAALAFRWSPDPTVRSTWRLSGIVYSVLAGVVIAGFSVVLLRIYAHGGDLSHVFPAVYGGAIALAAVIGWIVLREPFSVVQAAGVGAVALGVGLLALS